MRVSNRLTAVQTIKIKEPGRYADGNGLWLQVKPSGSRSWLFRYMRDGRARHMGLGPFPDVSLAEARAKAAACRKTLLDGQDPLEVRRKAQDEARLAEAQAMTFEQCAEKYISAHEPTWRNPKHRQQWRNTLKTYAFPKIGDLPINDIDTGLVMQVLEPIWQTKPETASRLRGRIEVILSWATARGYRKGDNPARWRGHLDQLLPARNKVQKVRHHASLPYAEIPTFISELRLRDSVSARALEFTVLTWARTGATIGAKWSEFDLDEKVWTVPAERQGTKSDKVRRVPLCDDVVELLKALPREKGNEHVLIGSRGRGLSSGAMSELLKGMGSGSKRVTVHGMRSTAKDWASEQTNYANEVSEAALWHVVADKTESAYRRGDLLEKRRRLMRDWAAYCRSPARTGAVVPIRGAQ